MQILFVHNNFPAQFRNLSTALARDPAHRVAAVGSATARDIPGVELHRYQMPAFDVSTTHPFARRFDIECRRATQVLFVLTELRHRGFEPDLVIGHCGWGETLPLRSVFPRAKIVTYCEFYYRPTGQDVHFDPEGPQLGVDGLVALHCKNASTLLSLVDADLGLSPTQWQKQTYPAELQSKIAVVHEGVDGDVLKPDPGAQFELPSGRLLHRGDEVLTFIARNLEPMRGYHVFMRALPEILARRPNAQVVIVGGDDVSYGAAPEDGRSWKSIYLDEIAGRVDLSRMHFLPHQPYERFVQLLQTSTVHVYLTVPFVLSWSLVEAMAVGCRVVASDTAPVREAIADGVSGLLTPFHDPDALAEKVCRILDDPGAFSGLGAAARETALTRYARKDCLRRTLEALGVESDRDSSGDAPPRGNGETSPPAPRAPFTVRRRAASSAPQNIPQDISQNLTRDLTQVMPQVMKDVR
jgi:glycosyltransferase involved in cell wall biosynthesis